VKPRDADVALAVVADGEVAADIVEGGFRRLIDNEEENVKILVYPR
jgi:hypothetical protein